MQLNFIIGIGRSGTTILTKLLNTYKDVHCLPEANFLVFFLQKFQHKKEFTKKDIDQIFNEINLYALSHPWVGWQFNSNEVKKKLNDKIESNPNLSFYALVIFIYQQFKVIGYDKSEAIMLIDKNPSYTIFVKHISRYFTHSKFIFIVRDYRANILSRKQSIYLKSPNIAYNAIRWKLYNTIALSFYKMNKNKVLLIKYEDLVIDSEKEFSKIHTFLNISTEIDILNTSETVDLTNFKVEPKYKDRFTKKYTDLDKQLNSSRLNSWMEQLSKDEIKICDVICADVAKEFRYEPHTHSSMFKILSLKISHVKPIINGNIDIIKDKLLYYFPIQFKLNRLTKKYIEVGFIKK